MTYSGAFGISCQLLMNHDTRSKAFSLMITYMLNAQVIVLAPYTLIPKEQGGTYDMKGVFIKRGLLTTFGVDMQKVVVKSDFWPKRHCRT